jgi:RNA polymerase sigma-70 factor (ECF subfamily)
VATSRRSARSSALVSKDRTSDPAALDDALQALAVSDSRKAQVIELRFIGGLSVEETAETLQVSADTVMRNWRLTEVWLLKELRGNR